MIAFPEANTLKYGAFAPSATGDSKEEILENEFIRITFTNKGGKIKEALLKKHYKTVTDSSGKDGKELVKMLNSPMNKFDYLLPVPASVTKTVNTGDLYFSAEKNGNSISFKANTVNGGYFEQKYELSPTDYTLGHTIKTKDLGSVLASGTNSIPLQWENHLGKYEKGVQFEQNYSTVYFKKKEESTDYCSCVSDDTKDLKDKNLEWVSHVNQFFNTSLNRSSSPSGAGNAWPRGRKSITRSDSTRAGGVSLSRLRTPDAGISTKKPWYAIS